MVASPVLKLGGSFTARTSTVSDAFTDNPFSSASASATVHLLLPKAFGAVVKVNTPAALTSGALENKLLAVASHSVLKATV
jgi:hypothetical protein